MSLSELNDVLKLQTKQLTDNVTVVTNKEEGNFVYHISKTRQKELVPNVGTVVTENENNTLPRVYTSNTFLGCLAGYTLGRVSSDFTYGDSDFKGGYYIHRVPFTIGLKPNKKILPDIKKVNEIWLVPYNKETVTYKPDLIDKFFVTLTSVYKTNKLKRYFEIYIDISSNMLVTEELQLEPGFYKLGITMTSNTIETPLDEIDYNVNVLETISKSDYFEQKKMTAALLGFSND